MSNEEKKLKRTTMILRLFFPLKFWFCCRVIVLRKILFELQVTSALHLLRFYFKGLNPLYFIRFTVLICFRKFLQSEMCWWESLVFLISWIITWASVSTSRLDTFRSRNKMQSISRSTKFSCNAYQPSAMALWSRSPLHFAAPSMLSLNLPCANIVHLKLGSCCFCFPRRFLQ